MQCISSEVIVKGFNKCCMSAQWMGLVMIHCRGAVKRMGMLAVSVRKMKALTVKV